jgi:hypothetical protein
MYPKGESMAERREADDISRAAQRMADAAEKMAELVSQIQARTWADAELLTEEEADRFALSVVHRARSELRREAEASTPTPQEVKAWTARREELRRTEDEL